MRTRLAIEQADFAEPVRRLHQTQQRLFALLAHRADAHGALEHRVQTARRIAALEQALPRRQPPLPGRRQQTILKGRRQMTEPLATHQP